MKLFSHRRLPLTTTCNVCVESESFPKKFNLRVSQNKPKPLPISIQYLVLLLQEGVAAMTNNLSIGTGTFVPPTVSRTSERRTSSASIRTHQSTHILAGSSPACSSRRVVVSPTSVSLWGLVSAHHRKSLYSAADESFVFDLLSLFFCTRQVGSQLLQGELFGS